MRIEIEITKDDVFDYQYRFGNGIMQHGTMPVCSETLSLFSQILNALEKSRYKDSAESVIQSNDM